MAEHQDGLQFVPAVLMTEPPEPSAIEAVSRQVHQASAEIEIELAGAKVRIGAGASETQIAAVIRALKGSA